LILQDPLNDHPFIPPQLLERLKKELVIGYEPEYLKKGYVPGKKEDAAKLSKKLPARKKGRRKKQTAKKYEVDVFSDEGTIHLP